MPELNDAEWRLLAGLVEERFGLAFGGARRAILEGRLRSRLEALRMDSYLAYYHFLRLHPNRPAELEELGRRLVNHESYFFRESHHFDVIVRHLVPELAGELRARPLRVLSAGCAAGEEPYSLVIALQNAGLELRGISWEIDACDLSAARLDAARRAVYERGALRGCDAETISRYFVQEAGGYRLKERYTKGVRLFQANLALPLERPPFGSYDVILCRNMLIYFTDAAFAALIERFDRLLPEGRTLMLGHSESLIDKTPYFVPEFLEGVMVYRRVAGGAAR